MKMKKLIHSLIVVFFCITATPIFIGIASGKTITSDVAQIVAANFFKQNADVSVKTVSLAYTETSSSGEAVYFVFNIIPVGTPPNSCRNSTKRHEYRWFCNHSCR
jgi:hypothetical protein